MNRIARIVIFFVLFIALSMIFMFQKGILFLNDTINLVIYTTLIMMAFASLFFEHYFTKPTDVIATTISIILLLLPIRASVIKLGVLLDIYLYYCLTLFIISILALIFLNEDKTETSLCNRSSNMLRKIAATFGNSKVLYFTLFLLTAFHYVDTKSTYFLMLFIYSIIVILVQPKGFVLGLINSITQNKQEKNNQVGSIFSIQSKDVFLVKKLAGCADVGVGDVVKLRYQESNKPATYTGFVMDKYYLLSENWYKVYALDNKEDSTKLTINSVYKSNEEYDDIGRFIGTVDKYSTIDNLKFEYCSKNVINQGDFLEARVGDSRIIYQVINGTTNIEQLGEKNETDYIIGDAIQIGMWNDVIQSFDKYGWVPPINTPIYKTTRIGGVEQKENHFIIGNIPNTDFPVQMNLETAVTHHLGIFGITGCGKSVFARNLIKEIANSGTKVICVDFTNEYKNKISSAVDLITNADKAEVYADIDKLTLQLSLFLNQQKTEIIKEATENIHDIFHSNIEAFLNGPDKISVLDLPDVSNTSGILEFTKWFFKVAFEIAKLESNFGKTVCIVIEEAHTVIPEWNFSGIKEKESQPLVNAISQIALQGRKYKIGFVVIAQRTANVSKTIITQCNSIISFKLYDNTSKEFLSNYMGDSYAAVLPALKTRQAVAVGKAFTSSVPLLFEVPDICDNAEEEAKPE